MQAKPLILLILDGWGYQGPSESNAIALAKTPVWDDIWENAPRTLLQASGNSVGLPENQMGNSEVGHITMGAGRIVFQDLTRIQNAIEDRSFFENHILLQAIIDAKNNNKALHLVGLVSAGGVHSHEKHLYALIDMAAQQGLEKVYVQAILDGRDTPPKSAEANIKRLEEYMSLKNCGSISSVMGRYYAMDRDNRIDRTNSALDTMLYGKAIYSAASSLEALSKAYDRMETDEFVQPTFIDNHIQPGDFVIFFNFRADRARQITQALLNKKICSDIITMTEYDSNLHTKIAYPRQKLTNVFGEYIQNKGLSQARIAETEKYAHVTYFFNGGIETEYNKEIRVLIPSPKVATYDQAPEMSAKTITENIIKHMDSTDVIVANFANADMVGHTGNLEAAKNAIECIDYCLGILREQVLKKGANLLITADHGNAEIMWDVNANQPHTSHTTNLVPLVYIGNQKIEFIDGNYGLQDIAPTMLNLLNIEIPEEMDGISLIK